MYPTHHTHTPLLITGGFVEPCRGNTHLLTAYVGFRMAVRQPLRCVKTAFYAPWHIFMVAPCPQKCLQPMLTLKA